MQDFVAEAHLDPQRAAQRDITDVMAAASTDIIYQSLRTFSQPQLPLVTTSIPSFEEVINHAIQEALEAVNPLARDIRVVRDPTASEEEQVEALERLAEDVPWPLSEHAARGNVARVRAALATYVEEVRQARLLSGDAAHAEQSRVDARRDLLGQAILEVLADFDHPQRFRFGSGKGSFFVRDVPAHLPLADGWFHGWFHARVITTTERNLFAALEWEIEPPVEPVPLETLADRGDPTGDELLSSLETRWDDVDDPRLQAVLARVTPAEREVCQLLAEGHDTGRIAALLGKSESTVRVQRRQVQEKARRIPA